MYCVKCGVKLADSEKKCPLCNTVVYHPDFLQETAQPLYPQNKIPAKKPKSKALNGVVIIIFLIPLLTSLFSDLQSDNTINWFGFVAGGLLIGYIACALPFWFKKPNPVIFVPCNFAAIIIYLHYINFALSGKWFWSFALPVTGGVAVITCALVTLLYYIKKGKLYIWGGGLIAIGAFMLLVEFLLDITFNVNFLGWSIYPLVVLSLVGGILIYLGIDDSAREIMERKLFI